MLAAARKACDECIGPSRPPRATFTPVVLRRLSSAKGPSPRVKLAKHPTPRISQRSLKLDLLVFPVLLLFGSGSLGGCEYPSTVAARPANNNGELYRLFEVGGFPLRPLGWAFRARELWPEPVSPYRSRSAFAWPSRVRGSHSTDTRLSRLVAVSGCSGPSTFSRISSARSKSRCAAARSPWAHIRVPRSWRLRAVSGCLGPNIFSQIASARSTSSRAPAKSRSASSGVATVVRLAQGHLSRMCDEVIVKVSGSLGWSAGPAVPV